MLKNKKTVLLLGCFGYIGNALTQRLLFAGYKVIGIDNRSREYSVIEMNSYSAIEQYPTDQKINLFKSIGDFKFYNANINKSLPLIKEILETEKPGTVCNLAHQPSGPYSMIDCMHANSTLENNILGTNNILWLIKEANPDIHYTTIGSTGEYKHDCNIDVEEGYINIEHKGRTSKELIFPRCPTSIYHASKVASMYITEYLTRMWNLKTSEAEQAIVFGAYTKEIDETKVYSRLDTDGCFGTVLNKLTIQALLNIPLTIFGEGNHKRGFIALQDSVAAIMLSIENPPENGKLRVFNQLSEHRSMNELAEMVKNTAQIYGIDTKLSHIPSPRKEFTGDHFYNIISEILPKLGYKPSRTIDQEIEYLFDIIDLEYIQRLRDTIVKNIVF